MQTTVRHDDPASFDAGLRRTVQWYMDNRAWWEAISAARYSGQRLGTAA